MNSAHEELDSVHVTLFFTSLIYKHGKCEGVHLNMSFYTCDLLVSMKILLIYSCNIFQTRKSTGTSGGKGCRSERNH